MSEKLLMQIAVGDEVRVHFHPPVPMKSFVEGAVSRIDETVSQGPMIVVDVTHQVILDREAPIRRGHQDYILYERWNDFPEQIEVLSTRKEVDRASTPDQTPQSKSDEPNEAVLREPENASERLQVQVERQDVPRRGGLIAAIFGRQR
ncbi:hypothetical protein AA309_12845 [Microvirga vignae]|uniref:Uncharacterized protein n=1 Tax=Microvirga vignae TaxID=1225564 RepID=A0A0H1RCJ7_9HYPH|nr:hypothetical protein [Microvirga vignae]KLK92591.1 hypothetical protein AA309_12845 [Microvirga vignae]